MEGTKDFVEISNKNLEQTPTKLFLNLYCWFEQFFPKVFFENFTSSEVTMIL